MISKFADGTPAVLKNRHGEGCAYLAASPLENGLLWIRRDEFIQSTCFRMYDALFDECGVNRLLKTSDPRIEIGYMENADTGETMVICLNHDDQEVLTYLHTARKGKAIQLIDMEDNTAVSVAEAGAEISFGPAGVKSYRLTL